MMWTNDKKQHRRMTWTKTFKVNKKNFTEFAHNNKFRVTDEFYTDAAKQNRTLRKNDIIVMHDYISQTGSILVDKENRNEWVTIQPIKKENLEYLEIVTDVSTKTLTLYRC